jgi:hypothetical protein
LPGSDRCPWHDPAWDERRKEWSVRGGHGKSNAARAKKQMAFEAMTPAELQGYVAVALRGVMVGSITPGVANAVASLARAAVAVRAATELEARIEELEAMAGLGRRVG